jgi:hypothetical protein
MCDFNLSGKFSDESTSTESDGKYTETDSPPSKLISGSGFPEPWLVRPKNPPQFSLL